MSVASIPSPMMFGTPPQPTDAFAWVQAVGGPALVCRPLETYARHVFTSRRWMLGAASNGDSPAAWLEVTRGVGVDAGRLVRIHRVHGAHAGVVQSTSRRPDAAV